jgi:hypothetical protein
MSLKYEKILAEDLNLGVGSVNVTNPAGGVMTGNKIGIHTFMPGVVDLSLFEAKGDGVTDDYDAIVAAEAYARANNKTLRIDGKTYAFGTPFVFPAKTVIVGEPNNTRFKYIGVPTTNVVTLGPSTGWIYGTIFNNIIIDGNGLAVNGLKISAVVNGEFDLVRVTNVTGAGFLLDWAQLCLFRTPMVSNNIEAFTTTPVNGILISDNLPSSASTFINPTIEKVSGTGIKLQWAINNVFINGTSEGNNYGLEFSGQAALYNNVYGMDLEANTTADIKLGTVSGGNTFTGLESSSSGGIIIEGSSDNRIISGYSGPISLDVNSNRNKIDGILIFGVGNTITDNGYLTTILDVINVSDNVRSANKIGSGATSFNGKITVNGGIDVTGGDGLKGDALWVTGGLNAIGGVSVGNTRLVIHGADKVAGHNGLVVMDSDGVDVLTVDNSRIVKTADITPRADNTYNLGSKDNKWKDVNLDTTSNVYFGASDVDGSWRLVCSGANLNVEVRESGSWVAKGIFTPTVGIGSSD